MLICRSLSCNHLKRFYLDTLECSNLHQNFENVTSWVTSKMCLYVVRLILGKYFVFNLFCVRCSVVRDRARTVASVRRSFESSRCNSKAQSRPYKTYTSDPRIYHYSRSSCDDVLCSPVSILWPVLSIILKNYSSLVWRCILTLLT